MSKIKFLNNHRVFLSTYKNLIVNLKKYTNTYFLALYNLLNVNRLIKAFCLYYNQGNCGKM